MYTHSHTFFRRRAPEPVKLAEGFIKLSLDELNDPDLFYPLVTPTNQSRAFGARGLCRIYNQRDFKVQTGQSRRDGTDADADGVEKLFRKLNYSTETYLNSDYNEMMRTLKSGVCVCTASHAVFLGIYLID